MKSKMILLLYLFFYTTTHAQHFTVTPAQRDPFSIALIKLLQCSADNFSNCKGAFLQTTLLSETENELTIPIPGSITAIIRSGYWDKAAYIEFGPYKKNELKQAWKDIQQKIKAALGDQFYQKASSSSSLFSEINIKDSHGYFQSNMELMWSSTTEKSYLLKPSTKMEKAGIEDHCIILLKVKGGRLAYYHFIDPNFLSPDKALQQTLQQLIDLAKEDYKSLPIKDTSIKKRKMTNFQLNGTPMTFNRAGGNYSVDMHFFLKDSIAGARQWRHYQEVIQAATGSAFVYEISQLDQKSFIVYFNNTYDEHLPTLYLSLVKDAEVPYIELRIVSRSNHATSRAWQPDEE